MQQQGHRRKDCQHQQQFGRCRGGQAAERVRRPARAGRRVRTLHQARDVDEPVAGAEARHEGHHRHLEVEEVAVVAVPQGQPSAQLTPGVVDPAGHDEQQPRARQAGKPQHHGSCRACRQSRAACGRYEDQDHAAPEPCGHQVQHVHPDRWLKIAVIARVAGGAARPGDDGEQREHDPPRPARTRRRVKAHRGGPQQQHRGRAHAPDVTEVGVGEHRLEDGGDVQSRCAAHLQAADEEDCRRRQGKQGYGCGTEAPDASMDPDGQRHVRG